MILFRNITELFYGFFDGLEMGSIIQFIFCDECGCERGGVGHSIWRPLPSKTGGVLK